MDCDNPNCDTTTSPKGAYEDGWRLFWGPKLSFEVTDGPEARLCPDCVAKAEREVTTL